MQARLQAAWRACYVFAVRTLKLTLQYDGTNYVGWQRQPTGSSIQALVEDALVPIEGHAVTVHGAGRTDAGVHALGQVASVRLVATLDPATLGRALNAVLPDDVRIICVDEMPPTFHARFDARAKTYEYRILNAAFADAFAFRYAWHVPMPLDLERMRVAAAALLGRHDFAAFQGSGSLVQSTERTIETIEWEGGGSFDRPLAFRVTGDGFLRHMVRNIVGTLVDVGAGRLAPKRLSEILESRSRQEAGPTAPARGLFLVRVSY
jgi:tRNA pseudouridine38-40 synthase